MSDCEEEAGPMTAGELREQFNVSTPTTAGMLGLLSRSSSAEGLLAVASSAGTSGPYRQFANRRPTGRRLQPTCTHTLFGNVLREAAAPPKRRAKARAESEFGPD